MDFGGCQLPHMNKMKTFKNFLTESESKKNLVVAFWKIGEELFGAEPVSFQKEKLVAQKMGTPLARIRSLTHEQMKQIFIKYPKTKKLKKDSVSQIRFNMTVDSFIEFLKEYDHPAMMK